MCLSKKEILDYCHQAVPVIRFCHKELNSKMSHASSGDSFSQMLITERAIEKQERERGVCADGYF